jgi:hypothetical protein
MLRYDHINGISSDLDPIEDILNLITTLRSKGYTSDLLRQKHGFTNAAEINRTTKLIALHIDNAIGLSQQAFEGPAETSFLPLYYSTLNLCKVNLLILGKRVDLERNRWHGASYIESDMSKTFLNERIDIKNKGAIPLYYANMVGKTIPNNGIKVTLNDVYSQITSVSAEYATVTNTKERMLAHSASIIQDDVNGHYLRIQVSDTFYRTNPPKPRTLKAYKGLRIVVNNDGAFQFFESKKIKGLFTDIENQIKSTINRNLLSDQQQKGMANYWITYCPINGKRHVFNEELCITLAFFHLSNVVRYNPEHLYRLKDSRYWALMLALEKHGFFRFIKLMWGNYNRFSFDIT